MSDFTTTPNIGLYKPNFRKDSGRWGDHLNANADTLDQTFGWAAGGPFLPLAGGNMNGTLVLHADPVNPLDACTKQYADAHGGGGVIGGGGSSTVSVSDIPPPLLDGAFWFDSVNAQLFIAYNDGSSTAWVLANNADVDNVIGGVPITFSFAGKPATGAIVNVPMCLPLSIPNGLAGTMVYGSTMATAPAVFTVNRIVGGTAIVTIGSVTVTPVSNTSATLAGLGAALLVGDVLQLVAPAQDATLSNIGITLYASRVG